MNTCKTPCSDCPFRKNSLKGWLGNYIDVRELHDIVINAEVLFPCHMTHQEKNLDLSQAGTEQHPLCTGALQYAKKACKRFQDIKRQKMLDQIDRTQLDNILSVPEFFKHHQVNIKNL